MATFNYENTPNVFNTPLHFYSTQIIRPFLNSRISARHDKVDGHPANGEILIKGLFLYCRISFVKIFFLFRN